MQSVRPAAVAGMFYPAHPDALRAELDTMLATAKLPELPCPKALVVPHAGYVYSGPIAAAAFKTLQPWHARIHRVILLGPSHRMPLHGLALPSATCFETPLGGVLIDQVLKETAYALPQVNIDDRAHAFEHSLEVQLPFLQAVLDDFSLLPLAVGHASPDMVCEVLENLWGGPETLIVVSSDLSHYLPYETACKVDRETCQEILSLTTDIAPERACGAFPLNGLLLAAHRHGLQPTLLDLCNSGDTAGDRSRVVGYSAITFHEGDDDG